MISSTAAQQHSSKLQLRLATLEDAKVLLEWRNNSVTREASHNTSLLSEDEHIQWLTRILANENRQLYIAEIAGDPVGTVRVDSENLGYELSWTVSPTMRGSGIGRAMVTELANGISGSIRAEIKVGNIPSIRIAEEAKMVFEREENGVLHFRRNAFVQTNSPTDPRN